MCFVLENAILVSTENSRWYHTWTKYHTSGSKQRRNEENKMDMNQFLGLDKNEKPLEKIVTDGGYTGIFRTIACVGDSLSSGEFESIDKDGVTNYHDYYDYSWGQYIARIAGCTVKNFSKGGMSAKDYCTGWAEEQGFWHGNRLNH